MSVVKEKLTEQLTCAICLEYYKHPRTLPCLHSYCTNCISQLTVEVDNGQHMVRCPLCQHTTQLSDKGAASFPIAFHINNLLEIEELLRDTPLCHAHNDRPKDLYCNTCEELVCVKCVCDVHTNHRFDRAADLFTSHKQQIKACLKPMKNKIDEVKQTLVRFDTAEREMREQGEAVLKKIDDTYQQLMYELKESQSKASQEAATALQEKLQVHFLERANVKAVLIQLESCYQFAEEKLNSRFQYQVQAAKKQLVKHINDTHSTVKVSELQPAQEPNTVFTADKNTLLACRHIGDINSMLFFSRPGLFSVNVPSCVPVYRKAEVLLTAPVPLSAGKVSCKFIFPLSSGAEPVVCPITCAGRSQFGITIRSSIVGLHQLLVQVDGILIHGNPFNVHVVEWTTQEFVTFALGLHDPTGIAVTDDRQHVVVTERYSSCIKVLSNTGEEVMKFGSFGREPGEFLHPRGVTVSADNHIFVLDDERLHKFPFPTSHETSIEMHTSSTASVNMRSTGVAIHRSSGNVYLVNCRECNITVLNPDLTLSHFFGSLEWLPADIAIDTNGIVYATDSIGGKVLKFTPEGKPLGIIGSKGELLHQFSEPRGICIDSDDIIYVTDMGKHQVMVFNTEGKFLKSLGGHLGEQIANPLGVAVDKAGNLYVCDGGAGEVLVSKPALVT